MVIPPKSFTAALWVFHFSTFSLILTILQAPYLAIIIARERMNFFALVSIIDVLLKLAIVLTIPFVPFNKLIYYGFLAVICAFVNILCYYIYSRIHFTETRFSWEFNRNKFREMLSFAGWNTFGSFAYMIQGQGLNVLANMFFGPVVNAARAIAFQIQSSIGGFSENLATAFRPQLVESYALKDYERTETLMFSMSKYCFLMLTILSIPIILELHYILNLWLDGTIPEYTDIFTILVLINMIINSLNMPISQTVQATGFVKKYQLYRSILVTSTLPIAWIFLKIGYSAPIIFWTTLIVTIINQPLSMWLLHENFKFSYSNYIKNILFPCFFFCICAPLFPTLIKYLLKPSLMRLMVVIISSLITSSILAYLFFLTKSEQQIIKNLLYKLKGEHK